MAQPPDTRPTKLITLSGDCRELLRRCQSGHATDSCVAFAALNQTLLRATVLNPTVHFPPIQEGSNRVFALGRPGDALALTNGWFLRLLLTFRVEESASAGGAMKLKTLSSSIQYQRRADDADSWVFRYEYFRVARDHYAPGHFHIRATPTEECLAGKARLEDVHFPTGRVTLEAIIRLLIDDFGVRSNEPDEVWRPLLHGTETQFIPIARQPQARPDK